MRRREYHQRAKKRGTKRRPNGSWEDQIDPHYAAAMACLVLLTPEGRLAVRSEQK
jgi:hypothetical protein